MAPFEAPKRVPDHGCPRLLVSGSSRITTRGLRQNVRADVFPEHDPRDFKRYLKGVQSIKRYYCNFTCTGIVPLKAC